MLKELTRKELPHGLRGHAFLVNEVLGWCEDWISQDQFDDLARKAMFKGRRLSAISGDDYILGMSDQQHIGALQAMQRLRMVESKIEDGLIWYRASPSIRREREAE